MKGMILAAGFGTRLGELGIDLPKPLFPVCNVPLIRWVVSWLVGNGVDDILVNLHHRGELIKQELGRGEELGARISYSEEVGQILGTGGGVKRVLSHFGNETFVLVNGKIVVDLDLGLALEAHRRIGALATMVLKPDPDAARWGAIGVDPSGHVVRFLGRPAAGTSTAATDAQEHMFTGIHILEPAFVRRLPDGPCCIVRAGYGPGFDHGVPLGGHVHEGYFWDHSTPSRFLQGNLNLVTGRGRGRPAPGPVTGVAPDAEVHASAEVDSLALVGAGARIAAGARVGPGVVIGPGAEVGAGAHLTRAVVCGGAAVTVDLDSGVVGPGGKLTPVDLSEVGPRSGPALPG